MLSAFLRPDRPRGGRFSPEEKFEYFGVIWGTIILGVTGILMWKNSQTHSLLSERVIRICLIAHTFESFLALLHVGVIHMVRVVLAPNVFPFSPAMLTGHTSAKKLAECHAELLETAASEIRPQPQPSASLAEVKSV